MNDFLFADIEIEPVQKADETMLDAHTSQNANTSRYEANASRYEANASRYEALPIAPRTPDPIREKFYEMRRLSTQRPFPRNDSELFYRQARFMEDFEDNYDGAAAFNMYFPFYQRMGYDYLRTYFSWRTNVRRGEIKNTSLSYIFLYVYELLSNIGVSSPAEGLSKLMDIWDKFSVCYPPIRDNLSKWLKDYHVFYELPQGFAEFVSNRGLQKQYILTLLFEGNKPEQLAVWNNISGYDVTKSRFYRDGNEELLSKCFDAAVIAIQEFCKSKGASIEDMLVYSVSARRPWNPFANALFCVHTRQPDWEVHISKYEHYYCKNGEWTAKLPVYYSSQRDFIGYLIKKTEACLRAQVNYKYKLVAEMKPGIKTFRELQKPAAKRAELDKVIEHAVAEFYKDLNRIVIEVNHKSLERIREEALEIQEQLIVNGDDAACEIAGQTRNDEFAPHSLTLSFADGWKELGKTLTDTEKGALKIALGGGDVKAFALENDIMLEVLVDGINEKASDCIGDSIMELSDEVYVFDEYTVNMADML